ncbi:MAG: iron-sulfur cluster assembly accessory protein [Actinomycetota bacterium]
MTDVVTITDPAAARARALLVCSGLADGGLRVRVQSAGCEGFVAILDLAAAPLPEEIEVVGNGVRLFSDIASMLELPGATLDHRATEHGAEFVWSHPAATGVCACSEPHQHTFPDQTPATT